MVSSCSYFSISSKTLTLGTWVAIAVLLLRTIGYGLVELQPQAQAIQQVETSQWQSQPVTAVRAAPLRYKKTKPLRAPRRSVVLIGPHDRFNFGDLLFEKVVQQLLINRAGYLDTELISVGMVNVNMSHYGGSPQVWSANRAIQASRDTFRITDYGGATNGTAATAHNHHKGPFDVVFLGGHSLECDFSCGRSMLATEELRRQADVEKVSEECAYLFPKHLLIPPEFLPAKNQKTTRKVRMPVSIINSVESAPDQFPCRPALETADFISFRDLKQGKDHKALPMAQARPDCAVLTRVLFNNTTIAQYAASGEVKSVIKDTKLNGYLAVQLHGGIGNKVDIPTIAKGLDTVWEHANLTTVFFRAGSVADHDLLDTYRDITKAMKGPAILFETEHVWSVVALIARASAVVSTSLHVRIMAFIHQRVRVTICELGGKHHNFITTWEASDATACVTHNEAQMDPSAIWRGLSQSMMTPLQRTEQAIETAIHSYLEGFDEWSGLLLLN